MSPLLHSPSNFSSSKPQLFDYNNSTTCHGRGLWEHFLGQTSSGLPFFGFTALAVILLFVCAILAGLTLAIFTLDITRLYILSTAGDQRKRDQALVLSRIKRHSSWFLCSMVICSVACAESIPIVVEVLFGNGWLPIVISTIAIAIFAELLPQYLIPRRAIIWGYYCWPLIWGCMWMTCIISWPLSHLLDKLSGPQANEGIYTPEQMQVLIKFHERVEKHGGLLGPDASRVMRGALALDYQTLRDGFQYGLRKGKPPVAEMGEKAIIRADIIVPWSSVRCININEEVTKNLILRIKKWAYSRIPVVGNIESRDHESTGCCELWNNQKVYGFLHVKNLVGLEAAERDSQKLFVKDLLLYPLPIIREDMPLYDLLNVFQMGIARIAVVIPIPTKDRLIPLGASVRNLDTLPRHIAPLWSVLTGLNARNTIEMDALTEHIDWTTDFLDAAQNNMKPPQHRKHKIIGIGCPQPIGIVTYEDIVDAILQKTSLDEKDFFDRDHVDHLTKGGKEGDLNSVSSNHRILRTKKTGPVYVPKIHTVFEGSGSRSDTKGGVLRRRAVSGPGSRKNDDLPDIIRRRNIAGPDSGVDGPSEDSGQDFDGANERVATSQVDACNDSSSYTENEKAFKGFHYSTGHVELFRDFSLYFEDDAVDSKSLPASSTSLSCTIGGGEAGYLTGNQPHPSTLNCGVPHLLPRLRRETPFSKEASIDHERSPVVKSCLSRALIRRTPEDVLSHSSLDETDHESHSPKGFPNHHELQAGVKLACSRNEPHKLHDNSEFHSIDSSGPALSIKSDTLTTVSCALPVSTEQTSKMLAATGIPMNCRVLETPQKSRIRLLQKSFHDDRALLPSQRVWSDRKPQTEERRISLWF